MSAIDLEALIQPLSEENPVGEDLEYDPVFIGMEKASEGRAEQQMGDSVVEAEEPDWKAVKKSALDLLGRTRDLRVAVYLTRGLLRTDGLIGFNDGLGLLKSYLESFWDTIHPALDPDDNNDPTMRVNTLATLCDADTTVKSLRETPMIVSKAMGPVSLRDHDIATGVIPPPSDPEAEVPQLAAIDAAFMDCDLEELQAVSDAVIAAGENIVAIETLLTDYVGAGQSIDFSPLGHELKSQSALLLDRLARRGVGEGAEGEDGEPGEGGEAGQRMAGEIKSREDVVRVLDKICDYYTRAEPSSPIPILLQRAKRLVSKDFMSIMSDLAPTGLPEAEVFRGLDTEE